MFVYLFLLGSWVIIVLILFFWFEKIYAFLKMVLGKTYAVLKKYLKTEEEMKDNLEKAIDFLLLVELLLYIIILSYPLSLLVLGVTLFRVFEWRLLLISLLYLAPALLTHWARRRPLEGRNRLLKTGILLINLLIIVQGVLVLSKALLVPKAPDEIIHAIDSVLESLKVEISTTLIRDFLALIFFLGIYQILGYFEAPEADKKPEKWDIFIIASTLKALFVFPIVVFAILLAFDFISAFHAISFQFQEVSVDTIVAILSGIITMIIELIKERTDSRAWD